MNNELTITVLTNWRSMKAVIVLRRKKSEDWYQFSKSSNKFLYLGTQKNIYTNRLYLFYVSFRRGVVILELKLKRKQNLKLRGEKAKNTKTQAIFVFLTPPFFSFLCCKQKKIMHPHIPVFIKLTLLSICPQVFNNIFRNHFF